MKKSNVWVETFGDTALRAAQSGDSEALTELLEAGGNPDAPDRHGFTALARAAQYDRLDMVKALLVVGADPNAPCKWGITPLMAAKSVGVAEALLAAGADVDAATHFDKSGLEPGHTALMKAAGRGDLPIIELLLAHGADVEAKDSEGRTALVRAAADGNAQVSQALIDAGAAVGLVEAALLGDTARVRGLLAGGGLQPELMASALWWAAGRGQDASVRLLLEAGAPVDARGCRESTALMHAALCGQADAVDILISSGADVNAWNGRGVTALLASVVSASHGCKAEVVCSLLKAGAEVNARTRFSWPTHKGGTALMEASLHGTADCVRGLIEHGADLELSSDIDEDGVGGWTALQAAVANGRLEAIRLLVESGADVSNAGKLGMTPLAMARKWAPRTGRTDIVDFLVAKGAGPGEGSA